MGYKLKILSPLHIGCGEQLTGLNFILEGKKIHVVEPDAIISLLGDEKWLKFAQWLEVNSNDIDKLDTELKQKKWAEKKAKKGSTEQKQLVGEVRDIAGKLRIIKQKFNLNTFVDGKQLVAFEQLKAKAVYAIAIAAPGGVSASVIAPFTKQVIAPYTPGTELTKQVKPYIPGTELKGAIRTAVLYCALNYDDVRMKVWLKRHLEAFQSQYATEITAVANERELKKLNPNNPRQKLSEVKDFLAKEMNRISKQLEAEVFTCKPDAKYDVMKFLQVGDSVLLDATLNLVVSYVKPINISDFTLFYEFVRPEILIPLTSFKLETNNSRTEKLDKMGFSPSHKELMSGLDAILSCCYRFAADLLQEEIVYYTKFGKTGVVAHLKNIEKQNTMEAPVLRIGKDEGYSSLTVGLAVKKLMPELYESVLIHATKNKSYDSQHGGPFPKSRKIVHWEGKEMTAGWVQLIAGRPDQPVGKLTERAEKSPDALATVDLSALKNSHLFKGKR